MLLCAIVILLLYIITRSNSNSIIFTNPSYFTFSVRLEPPKSTPTSKVTPTSSYIPITKYSKALQYSSIYSSAGYPARSTQYQKHSPAIYDHLWIVVLLLSVILVLVILFITIAVVLFLRNRRKVGYRDQGVGEGNPLHEFREDFEQCGQPRGDTEQGVQVERTPESERHGGEPRLPQSSSEEERPQPSRTQQRLQENRLPEVVEGRFPGPEVEYERSPESSGSEECLRKANDTREQSHEPVNGDENVEKRSSFQGTAFSLRIGGYVYVYINFVACLYPRSTSLIENISWCP